MNYTEKGENLKYVVGNRTNTRFYTSTAWRKLRGYHIAINPLCVFCLRENRAVPAQVVDHIEPIRISPARKLDPTNLQSLCNACHIKKTNEDKKKYGKATG